MRNTPNRTRFDRTRFDIVSTNAEAGSINAEAGSAVALALILLFSAAPALAAGKMKGVKIPYVEIAENSSADPLPANVKTSFLDQASARPDPERFPPGVPVAPKAGLNPEDAR